MAERAVTGFAVSDQGRVSWSWTGLVSASSDTGEEVNVGLWSDICIQGFGTFGGSGTITVEGSNDGGTTWATLHDHTGADAIFTAAGIKQIAETPGAIRVLAGGTGLDAAAAHVSAAAKGR